MQLTVHKNVIQLFFYDIIYFTTSGSNTLVQDMKVTLFYLFFKFKLINIVY